MVRSSISYVCDVILVFIIVIRHIFIQKTITPSAKFTTKANPARLKTPTSRIGPNFSSLINFLMYARVFSQDDFAYLLDTLASLTEDLERAARVNRIMEAYTEYLLDAYFGAGRTVDESYWGEYEVENIKGSRELVLRKFDPKGKTSHPTFFAVNVLISNVKTFVLLYR